MTLDARNPELEAAIAKNPHDLESYLVYADWLIEQGDPRGELVTAQAMTERPGATADERRAALAVFARHRDYFLGALADTVRADAFDWKRGFIHHARIASTYTVVTEGTPSRVSLADVIGLVLAHPSARFLVKLTLGDPSPPPRPPRYYWERAAAYRSVDDFAGVPQRVAASAPATLRELECVSTTGAIRLGPMCPGLANLVELTARDAFGADQLVLPALRHATFAPAGMATTMLRELGAIVAPELQSLTLDFGANPSCALTDLDVLLKRSDLPRLTHLALVRCPFANLALARLAQAPLLARLEELQLVDSGLTDQGVRAVAREHRAFRHLELFDVTGNKLSGNGQRMLRAIAPQVIV